MIPIMREKLFRGFESPDGLHGFSLVILFSIGSSHFWAATGFRALLSLLSAFPRVRGLTVAGWRHPIGIQTQKVDARLLHRGASILSAKVILF